MLPTTGPSKETSAGGAPEAAAAASMEFRITRALLATGASPASAASSRLLATEVTRSARRSADSTKPARRGSNMYLPTSLPRIETTLGSPWMPATNVAT